MRLDSHLLCGRTFQYLLGLLLAGVLVLAPVWHSPALAGSESVEISGDGVKTTVTLSLSQLQGMDQYEAVYSAINTWPTKKWYVGKGVKISDLLKRADMLDTAKLVKFYAQDGYAVTLTVEELLNVERYYFPNLKNNSESEGNVPGSPAGAKRVEAMLGLISAEGSDDAKYMNDVNTLLLMIGQRSVVEQTGNLFVKYINKIEVLTDAPEKWDAPKANPAAGTIPAGSMITLSNNNNDEDKIYYTTDGSEPNMNSAVYNWIAKRWWASRADELGTINHPIGPIDKTTTIKAITIGAGKLNSDVSVFTYVVGEEPVVAPVLETPGTAQAAGKVITLVIGQTQAVVDGNPYALEVAPYIQAEAQRTLVPLRFVSEALGANVEWRTESGQVVITMQGQEIVLTPGSTEVSVNGAATAIDCAPEIQPPGRTFVPLRFISETLGAKVDFDQASYTVTITK